MCSALVQRLRTAVNVKRQHNWFLLLVYWQFANRLDAYHHPLYYIWDQWGKRTRLNNGSQARDKTALIPTSAALVLSSAFPLSWYWIMLSSASDFSRSLCHFSCSHLLFTFDYVIHCSTGLLCQTAPHTLLHITWHLTSQSLPSRPWVCCSC